jgi:hypothetical protein
VVGKLPAGLLQGPPGVRLAGEPAEKEPPQGLLSLPLCPRHPPPEALFRIWENPSRARRFSRSDWFPSPGAKRGGIPPVSAQTRFVTHC